VVASLESFSDPGEPEALRLATLALAMAAAPDQKDLDRAIVVALRAAEADAGSANAVSALVAVLSIERAERAPAAALPTGLPRVPSYGIVDRLLAVAANESPERRRELLQRLDVSAADGAASRTLAYLEASSLEEAGSFSEAAAKFAALAAYDPERPEPPLHQARCLCAAGDPAGAERCLREAIERGVRESKDLWDLWLAVNVADLARSPATVLAALPRPGGLPDAKREAASSRSGGYHEDIVWLLERLAAGDSVRINCGGEETREDDGSLWGRDRFACGGEAAPAYPATIARAEPAPVRCTVRSFPEEERRLSAYRVPLPPGKFRVTLRFARVHLPGRGRLLFDVAAEGIELLSNDEPGAGEERIAIAAVHDGVLDIEFRRRVGDPQVSAIAIARVE
jgi:tetratricopeptide (TPR) repeat protein